MIIQFITRCHQPVSTVAMFQLCLECMPMLRPVAKLIMCAMMDAKVIKVLHSYAPTALFSIRRSSHAIGGIMLIAAKQQLTTGESFFRFFCCCRRSSYPEKLLKYVISAKFSSFWWVSKKIHQFLVVLEENSAVSSSFQRKLR